MQTLLYLLCCWAGCWCWLFCLVVRFVLTRCSLTGLSFSWVPLSSLPSPPFGYFLSLYIFFFFSPFFLFSLRVVSDVLSFRFGTYSFASCIAWPKNLAALCLVICERGAQARALLMLDISWVQRTITTHTGKTPSSRAIRFIPGAC